MGINPTNESEHSALYERALRDAAYAAEIASACLHGRTHGGRYYTTAGTAEMHRRLHEYLLSRLREERRLAREAVR